MDKLINAKEASKIVMNARERLNSYEYILESCIRKVNDAVKLYHEDSVDICLGSIDKNYIQRLKDFFINHGYAVDTDYQESTTGWHLIIMI